MCNMNVPADDAASLNSQPEDDSSQTSETSDTSEASSPDCRPVPRKRTFLDKSLLNSNPESDDPPGTASVAPEPGQSSQSAQGHAVSAVHEHPQQSLSDEEQPVFSESKNKGILVQKGDRSVKASSANAVATLKLKDGFSGQTQRPGGALT